MMDVKNENDNKYDPYAMLVVFPVLSKIPEALKNSITRERKGDRPEQRVKEVAGKVVGHVPANLCKVFRKLSENGLLAEDIKVLYTGIVAQSVRPPSGQSYWRNLSGGLDRPGGGVDIHCQYLVRVKKKRVQTCP